MRRVLSRDLAQAPAPSIDSVFLQAFFSSIETSGSQSTYRGGSKAFSGIRYQEWGITIKANIPLLIYPFSVKPVLGNFYLLLVKLV